MQVLLYIAIIILFLLVALMIMPLRVRIGYQRDGFNDKITFEMSLWKLPKFKIVTPLINLKVGKSYSSIKFDSKTKDRGFLIKKLVTILGGFPKKADDSIDENFKFKVPHSFCQIKKILKKGYQQYLRYYPCVKYLLSHTQCRQLYWRTKIGLEDAALTGWSTGVLWTVKSLMVNKVFGLTSLPPRPIILVEPEFNEKIIAIGFDCIFEVRMGHIMVTGIKLALRK